MKIIIHREGQDYGPYTAEEVREHLADGTITENDLAWNEGATEWAPLKDVMLRAVSDQPSNPLMEPIRAPEPVPIPPVKEKSPLAKLMIMGCALGGVVLLGMGLLVLGMIFKFGHVSIHALGPSDFSDTDFSDFSESSYLLTGDFMVATMQIKPADTDKLCDTVMRHIYTLATKHSDANKLQLTVRVTADDSDDKAEKDATVRVANLGAVRNYSDSSDYEKSDQRTPIKAALTAAGL